MNRTTRKVLLINCLCHENGGTEKLTSAEIDSRFDFMAVPRQLPCSMNRRRLFFFVFKQRPDPGLDLLAQILIHLLLNQNKFELARQLKNEELRRLKDDPQSLAFREFNRLIYRGKARADAFPRINHSPILNAMI